jgi:hypothetical protein
MYSGEPVLHGLFIVTPSAGVKWLTFGYDGAAHKLMRCNERRLPPAGNECMGQPVLFAVL